MAGKGGGAWKVAYADFVTAMMAFFMVMWLTSQNQDIKEAIAHSFEDPFSFYDPQEGATSAKPKPGPASNVPLPKQPETKDKKVRRSRRPTLLTLGDGNHTTTGTILFFAPQSAELTDEGRQRLEELLPSILGKPQKLEIRGHASRRPLPPDGPYRDAWQLSYARCLATMQYLEEHGIGAERMRLSQAGVYEPYGKADGPEKLAQQERVEVNLLNEIASDSITRGSEPPAADTEPPVGGDAHPPADEHVSAPAGHGPAPAQEHGEAPAKNHAAHAAH